MNEIAIAYDFTSLLVHMMMKLRNSFSGNPKCFLHDENHNINKKGDNKKCSFLLELENVKIVQ